MATAVSQHALIRLVRAEAGEYWTHHSTCETSELLAVADLLAVAVAAMSSVVNHPPCSGATVEAVVEEEAEEEG